jgi:hypothetical protein
MDIMMTGTKISLSEELDSDPAIFGRAYAEWAIGKAHFIRALAAPLRINATGSFDRDVSFAGETFTAGTQVESRYRFDSYRLSYRYRFYRSPKLFLGIGVTAKIRDASISIEDGQKKAEKTNTGFVPLINFELDWKPGRYLGFLVEGDALAAPQGRAEDVLAAVYFVPADRWRLKAGYRILEGGVDNDEVYNFTLVNYLVAGISRRF